MKNSRLCENCIFIAVVTIGLVVFFGWYYLGAVELPTGQLTAAWVQALGSVSAIIAAIYIAQRESREHDRREEARRKENRAALALSLLRRVRERAEEVARLQIANTVDFPSLDWKIPAPLRDNANIVPFVVLGLDFLSAISRLHDLRRERMKMLDRMDYDKRIESINELPPPPQPEEIQDHLTEVHQTLRLIEDLLIRARDGS